MSRPDASICQCLTQPEEEPVTLAEVKEHLRVDGSDEDTLISGYISAARESLENECRRALVRQQWVAYIKHVCGNVPVELPRARLIEEGFALEYRDTAGGWQPSTDFTLQAVREPALLWITATPSDIDSPRSPEDAVWRATFWAGYGDDATSVPHALKHAVFLMAAHLYERREIVISGATISEIPNSLDRLLNPFRVPWGGSVK